jgi:hypothetical protein
MKTKEREIQKKFAEWLAYELGIPAEARCSLCLDYWEECKYCSATQLHPMPLSEFYGA